MPVRMARRWQRAPPAATGALTGLALLCFSLLVQPGLGGYLSHECPCFCDERGSTGDSPFWNEKFGLYANDECGTACASRSGASYDSSVLGVCEEFVDYKYCGRRLSSTVGDPALVRVNATTTQDYHKYLASLLTECSGTLYYSARVEAKDDCGRAILRAGCAMLFPKCTTSDTAPLPMCESTCVNERKMCRDQDSNYGPLNYIAQSFCGFTALGVAGPSDECTGAAGSVQVSSFVTTGLAVVVGTLLLAA